MTSLNPNLITSAISVIKNPVMTEIYERVPIALNPPCWIVSAAGVNQENTDERPVGKNTD